MKITKKVARKLAIILTLVLILQMSIGTNVAKAYEEGDVIASFTYADGVTRYLKYGEYDREYPIGICLENHHVASHIKEAGFDKYGTIWIVNSGEVFSSCENEIMFSIANPYDYNIHSGSFFVRNIFTKNYPFQGSNLIYDENNEVIGFKALTGEIREVLNLEEQNEILELWGIKAYDFRTYLPGQDETTPTPYETNTPQPSADIQQTQAPNTSVPTQEPMVSSEPVNTTPTLNPTPKPATTPEPTVTATSKPTSTPKVSTKASLKTESGYKVYYKGDTAIGKYKLKSGKLTYNDKTYKKVKTVGFIKKSGNVVYLTKKGQAYLLKGKKKKTLLKKNAKKLVKSGGFVTKIKKKNGKTLSVVNK